MKDSPNLDALRACAVGFVVLSHLPYFVGWEESGRFNLKALGHLGVAMFFVHTTLVLLFSLERNGSAAGPFLVRRFFRIYPLAIAAVMFFAGLLWLGGKPVSLGTLMSNILLVQNITGDRSIPDPLWTLPYEVQMYLFLPGLYLVARSARSMQWAWLLFAGSLALAALSGIELLQYVPCFLPGVLAFSLRDTSPRFGPSALFAVIITGALTIPALVAAGLPETPLLWAMCLVLGIVIPRCRRLTSKPVATCAKTVATYSYGIYLTHVLALGLAFPTAHAPSVVQWGVLVVMLPTLAVLVYHTIEKPGIRLGAELARKWALKQPVRPGAEPG
jgi:peptidoglycan/LPS O-acetylase OafA/YrhL